MFNLFASWIVQGSSIDCTISLICATFPWHVPRPMTYTATSTHRSDFFQPPMCFSSSTAFSQLPITFHRPTSHGIRPQCLSSTQSINRLIQQAPVWPAMLDRSHGPWINQNECLH